jgi:hypothetical protein
VVLLGVPVGLLVTGTVTLNEVLGYTGMAAAAILIMRVIAGVVRDDQRPTSVSSVWSASSAGSATGPR